MSFKNSWKTRWIFVLMSYGMYLLLRGYCNEILFEILFNGVIWEVTKNIFIDIILFFMILMIPVTIMHEWLHAIVYKLFGGKVKYRVRGFNIQAQEVTKKSFHRTKYLLILITPLIILSLASMLIPGWIGGTLLILNLFKSTGDIVKITFLLRANSNSTIIEKNYGFDIVDVNSPIQLTFEKL